MFGAKKETIKEENNSINVYELQVENEKLKIKVETLQFKLDQANEKYLIVEKQLKEIKNTDIERTKSEILSLKQENADLKFKMANDTKSIELETENKKLKSQIDIQQSENEHLNKLLNIYRAMPDVKNMIDNMFSMTCDKIDGSDVDFVMNHKKCINCSSDSFEDSIVEPERSIYVDLPNITHNAWMSFTDGEKKERIKQELLRQSENLCLGNLKTEPKNCV